MKARIMPEIEPPPVVPEVEQDADPAASVMQANEGAELLTDGVDGSEESPEEIVPEGESQEVPEGGTGIGESEESSEDATDVGGSEESPEGSTGGDASEKSHEKLIKDGEPDPEPDDGELRDDYESGDTPTSVPRTAESFVQDQVEHELAAAASEADAAQAELEEDVAALEAEAARPTRMYSEAEVDGLVDSVESEMAAIADARAALLDLDRRFDSATRSENGVDAAAIDAVLWQQYQELEELRQRAEELRR